MLGGFWKIANSYHRKQDSIHQRSWAWYIWDCYDIMYSFAYFVLVRVDELIMILPGLFATASLWNIIHVISVIWIWILGSQHCEFSPMLFFFSPLGIFRANSAAFVVLLAFKKAFYLHAKKKLCLHLFPAEPATPCCNNNQIPPHINVPMFVLAILSSAASCSVLWILLQEV